MIFRAISWLFAIVAFAMWGAAIFGPDVPGEGWIKPLLFLGGLQLLFASRVTLLLTK